MCFPIRLVKLNDNYVIGLVGCSTICYKSFVSKTSMCYLEDLELTF